MANNPHTIATEDIRLADVLLGRGKLVHHHPGNTAYRMDIKCRSSRYKTLDCIGRDEVARHVFELVRQRGGRFLRRTSNEILWETCADRTALTKVKQALRDSIRQPISKEGKSGDGGPRIEGDSKVCLNINKELPGPSFIRRPDQKSSAKGICTPREHYDSALEDLSKTEAASKKGEATLEFADEQLERSQGNRERQPSCMSQSSNNKRTRYDAADFHSMRASQGEESSVCHSAVADCAIRQAGHIDSQFASSGPLHQLRQMRLRGLLIHHHNNSILQATIPTAHVGTLVPIQFPLGVTDSSRRDVSPLLQTALSSGTDTIEALRQGGVVSHPGPFMDNQMAIVLRRLREGYTGNSSLVNRNDEGALRGSQHAILE